jgi:hypothetical protein
MGGIISGNSQFASGGVSGPQMAYAQYGYGQNILNNAAQFAGTGQSGGIGGASTMETMANAGAGNEEALKIQQLSQADANALANNKTNQTAGIGKLAGNLGTIVGSV